MGTINYEGAVCTHEDCNPGYALGSRHPGYCPLMWEPHHLPVHQVIQVPVVQIAQSVCLTLQCSGPNTKGGPVAVTLNDNGVLYVSQPALERVWVSLKALPALACAMALAMLSFLEKLKAGRMTEEATTRAVAITVTQFKHDLVKIGVVPNTKHFSGQWVRQGCLAGGRVRQVHRPSALSDVHKGISHYGHGSPGQANPPEQDGV